VAGGRGGKLGIKNGGGGRIEKTNLQSQKNQNLLERVEAQDWAVGENNRIRLLQKIQGSFGGNSEARASYYDGSWFAAYGGANWPSRPNGKAHPLDFAGRKKEEALKSLARELGTEGAHCSSIIHDLVAGNKPASALVRLEVVSPEDFASALGWLRDPLQERADVAVLNEGGRLIRAEIIGGGKLAHANVAAEYMARLPPEVFSDTGVITWGYPQ
jgi:hypothetical protein